jgi:hypothetical protein
MIISLLSVSRAIDKYIICVDEISSEHFSMLNFCWRNLGLLICMAWMQGGTEEDVD